MKFTHSIRWRLLLWYGMLLSTFLTGLGAVAYHFEHARKLEQVDTELLGIFREVEQLRRSIQDPDLGPELEERLNAALSVDYAVSEDFEYSGQREDESVEPLQSSTGALHSFTPKSSGEDTDGDGAGPPPRPPEEVRTRRLEENPDVDPHSEPPPQPQRGGKDRRGGGGRGRSYPNLVEMREFFGPEGRYYFCIWFHNPSAFYPSYHAPKDIRRPVHTGTYFSQRGEFREVSRMPAPNDHILVGRSTKEEMAALHAHGWKLAGGGVLLLAVSLAGGWVLISHALRPVREISETAQRIAGGDLTQRIDLKEAESELGGLAEVLNSTFARLEAAFNQQSRFTADAAHELRTPVTVILTHAQNGLGADGGTEEHQEAFGACQRAAQRMRRLIESLLQLSRIDAGEEVLRRDPCDLAGIAAECLAMIQPLADEKRIKIHRSLHPAPVLGDHDRLAQILTNLLTNAVYYNKPSGEVTVTTGEAEGGPFCQVSDTGQGIAPEHLPHVFERFYRADRARTSHFGKSGLGLAISKAITEAHGGELEAESQAGRGSTFTLRLPPVT